MKYAALMVGFLGLGLAGCATSNDPREGGLFGYWQHGESGYRERLEDREQELAVIEEEGAAAGARSERLQQELASKRAELEQQQRLLADLEAEAVQLNQEVEALPTATGEAADARQAIQDETASLRQAIGSLEQNTDLLVKERRREIMHLKKELKLLRERASLLTTL